MGGLEDDRTAKISEVPRLVDRTKVWLEGKTYHIVLNECGLNFFRHFYLRLASSFR